MSARAGIQMSKMLIKNKDLNKVTKKSRQNYAIRLLLLLTRNNTCLYNASCNAITVLLLRALQKI